MGGTGNTGAEPKAQFGAATSVEGTGAPGWAAPASPLATAALGMDAPPASTQPPALRPYEMVDASTGSGATTAPNLGFPTAAPTVANPMGFSHEPYPVAPAEVPTYAGAVPPPVVAAPPPADVGPKESPMDWLYPGNLPSDFHTREGKAYGMPWDYAATGASYTPGYGAAGNFGGVAGYGPQQKGLEDKVLLPKMAAGTQLKDAQIDQYNRVRREDYDRYMKLYGVGYDLPAYQQALNGLVYQQNMAGYGGTGGG